MRISKIRVAWCTCVALGLLGVGCVGTVDDGSSSYEQQESPASASDPSTDPGADADDVDASDLGGDPAGGGSPSDDPDADPATGNPGTGGNPDASVPAPANDAGVGQTPPPPTQPPPTQPPPTPPPSGDAEAQSLERGAGIYPAMCGGCHGARAQGGRGPSLTGYSDFSALASEIDSTMPLGNPGACNRTCAEDLSRYIIATFGD